MRILFLSQLVPYPPDAGAKVRSYHVLRYLAQQGHIITLACWRRVGDSEVALDGLSDLCDTVHTVPLLRAPWRDLCHYARSLVNGQPFLIARDHAPALVDWLADHLAQTSVDAIHADQLWMAPVALAAATLVHPRPRLTLDQHNATFLVARRLAELEPKRVKRRLLAREARRMLDFERAAVRRFDRVVWVTAEDRAALAEADENSAEWLPNSTVIPIAVDVQASRPVAVTPSACRVTFVGGMHWPPNAEGIAWFARAVWPQVVAAVPQARLTVIGRQPPFDPAAAPIPNLDAPGYVADFRPYLAETAVFIVPLRAGGGMRVKILEAWAWGLPVVATTLGAEGISYRPGEELLVADDAAEFAAAVITLLNDPTRRRQLSAAGRACVERHYDRRAIYPAWDKVYADA